MSSITLALLCPSPNQCSCLFLAPPCLKPKQSCFSPLWTSSRLFTVPNPEMVSTSTPSVTSVLHVRFTKSYKMPSSAAKDRRAPFLIRQLQRHYSFLMVHLIISLTIVVYLTSQQSCLVPNPLPPCILLAVERTSHVMPLLSTLTWLTFLPT